MSWLTFLKRILAHWEIREGRMRFAGVERRRLPPGFEAFEDRLLLAWSPLGPAPQLDPAKLATAYDQPVTGRVAALAVAGGNLLLGSASGGVWWDNRALANEPPQWKPTDLAKLNPEQVDIRSGFPTGLIDTGALAVDIFGNSKT